MLVYTKSCVTVPSSLFTVGTVTGVVVTFLTLLRLTGFLLAFCICLEHGLHEDHALIAPRILVGLLGLRQLTCCYLEGLTIAVIAMAVQGVVGLEGTVVGFAMLAELFTATSGPQMPCALGYSWLRIKLDRPYLSPQVSCCDSQP
jgi:hypothetical protein